MSDKTQATLLRLLKGFVAGAVGSMIMLKISSSADFTQLVILLKALLLAGISGGISGLLLALQKWSSWTE